MSPKRKTRNFTFEGDRNFLYVGNFAGKLKQMKGKNEKVPAKEEPQEENTGSVDQIKKKYGYTSSTGVSATIAFISCVTLFVGQAPF